MKSKDTQKAPYPPELNKTFHRIVEWNVAPRAFDWMKHSSQTILVVGNMPDVLGSKKVRYPDTPENREVQRVQIDKKVREWVGDTKEGQITVALCSGSRGADLEAYHTVQQLREERPRLVVKVVSILPVDKESFRKESVIGSTEAPQAHEEKYSFKRYWNDLYQDLLHDKDAVVHEPRFRPLWAWEYAGLRRKVTLERAVKRSEFVNGNQNSYRVFSDTQEKLIELARKAQNNFQQINKTLRMLLVTDGGIANGDGGTNEMVARFFKDFEPEILKNQRHRPPFDTVHVIQAGMNLEKGRVLASPLEDRGLAQNGEYIASVIAGYNQTFEQEQHDSWKERKDTVRQRRRERKIIDTQRRKTPNA